MSNSNMISILKKMVNFIKKTSSEIKKSMEQREYNKFLKVYYKNEFQNKKELHVYDNISHERVSYFYLLPSDAKIKFHLKFTCSNTDEPESYKKILEIFKILETHNRKYNIEIEVNNREYFRKSTILEHSSNINLTIFNDLYRYTKEKYLEEEKVLEELIFPIRNSSLSPYEKYLAVYNIVKQYNVYNEDPINSSESRYLRYILKGDYIVCVGFSHLLETLLDKVSIPCMTLSAVVKEYYDTEDGVFYICGGHQRNVVKIDDDKYNIHGIYVVDSTWDNDIELDLYNHANMTFDRTKELENLEVLKKEDFLLDFHDFDEYNHKINFYLKRKIKEINLKINDLEKIIYAYEDICREIMKILYRLDYNKWKEFLQKYEKIFKGVEYKEKKESSHFSEFETIYKEFLTEYGHYIINLSNNKISQEVTYDAAKIVKEVIEQYSDEEMIEWELQVKEINDFKEQDNFPYIYDYSQKRKNYLRVRKKRVR
ncbi:MAG: hypothetical protein IJE89_05835 [Bacilli bacterium]|nr:hypothetical protein [Bacilli bacterium]